MPFTSRGISLAFTIGMLVALPGLLLLGPRPSTPPSRASLTAVRLDDTQPAHDWHTMPRPGARLATPTPVPTAVPSPQPPAPVAVRPAPPPPPPPPPRPAPPPVVVGSRQQALINGDRAANGLGPLTWSSCLYAIAAQNAQRMAAQGFISHTNGVQLDLGCHLGYRTGENVGYTSAGINDAQLNTLFMNSPEHRANILGPYRFVATAWVIAPNGYGYVAVEFG